MTIDLPILPILWNIITSDIPIDLPIDLPMNVSKTMPWTIPQSSTEIGGMVTIPKWVVYAIVLPTLVSQDLPKWPPALPKLWPGPISSPCSWFEWVMVVSPYPLFDLLCWFPPQIQPDAKPFLTDTSCYMANHGFPWFDGRKLRCSQVLNTIHCPFSEFIHSFHGFLVKPSPLDDKTSMVWLDQAPVLAS